MDIVVNGDDYGKDENATLAIAESFKRGYISQATLMVNMPWADKAVEIARKQEFADRIGLHITLTEGFPLTQDMMNCPVFCNADGSFRRNGIRTHNWVSYDRADSEALERELVAQIEKFLSYQLTFLHCDGHHHAHIVLPVYYQLVPLLEKYGFKSVRRSVSAPWEKLFHPRIFAWCMDIIRYFVGSRKFRFVDHFGSVEYFMQRRMLFSDNSRVEVMVHPRYNSNGELVDFKSINGRLMSEVARELKEATDVFCTYEEL